MDWATRSKVFMKRGQKTVLIEDLVSTGKSSLQVADVLKREGLNVIGLVSIFTYDFPIASSSFEAGGLECHSLTSYPVLIRLAIDKGTISADQEDILLKWRDDPANWNGVL